MRFALYVTVPPAWLDPAEATPSFTSPYWMLYALHDAVMKPMPDTAPRRIGLDRICASVWVWAKALRSQNADHGATMRINPASRKYAAKMRRVKVEMSASHLVARQPGNPDRHVHEAGYPGVDLHEHRERPLVLSHRLQ